jgi:UDP-N-acetylmuramoyl-tripeptide--D-alanyl-D-alanine ligase
MEGVRLVDAARAFGVSVERTGDVMVTGVSIDSRTISAGALFFAIRGERYDGHAFVREALERGAAAAVVSDVGAVGGAGRERLLVVPDTVPALGDLAAWYRRRLTVDVVGITGTNGKTTTKDMAHAVIAATRPTLKTEANLNSQIGVPLTVMRLERTHEAAVIEMGTDRPGQISRLTEIAAPRVGVITNVSEAHLQTMGGIEDVARAKGEILDALPADGVAVLNGDDARVMSQAGRARGRVVTFGFGQGADVRGVDVTESERGARFRIEGGRRVEISVRGRHNVMNALAALAVGKAMDVPIDGAADALARFNPSPRRTAFVRVGQWTVIDDSYNCNPGSLRAALETLVAVSSGRPTAAALGDMLELGVRSASAHEEAGRLVAELGIGLLFMVGRETEAMRTGAIAAGMAPDRVKLFDDKRTLVEALRGSAGGGPLVLLVKGSRGMRMEEVVEQLTRETPVS